MTKDQITQVLDTLSESQKQQVATLPYLEFKQNYPEVDLPNAGKYKSLQKAIQNENRFTLLEDCDIPSVLTWRGLKDLLVENNTVQDICDLYNIDVNVLEEKCVEDLGFTLTELEKSAKAWTKAKLNRILMDRAKENDKVLLFLAEAWLKNQSETISENDPNKITTINYIEI